MKILYFDTFSGISGDMILGAFINAGLSVDTLKEELKKDYEVIDIDGVRIEFPDGWGLIRASNTQPALVLRFEAETKERLEEIRSLIEGKLEEAKNT